MNNSKIITNIGIGVLVLLGVGAIYYYFFGSQSADQVGISTTAVPAGSATLESADTSEFLILLDTLQTVSLEGKIFNNTIFASQLENFAISVPPRAQGRSNPFAPLGTANFAPRATNEATSNQAGEVAGTINFLDNN